MTCKVLFVDDDDRILNAFKRRLYKQYQFYTAVGAKEGLEVLGSKGPFAVVMSDQKMPGMDGITFLKKVMDISPLTVRMMLTGNVDRQTAVDSVNESHVFRYLNKPCTLENLTAAIDDAIHHHKIMLAEKELLEQTLAGSVKLLVDILALTDLEVMQQTESIRKAAKRLCQYIKYQRLWELDMAIMLAPIGEIVMPLELRNKRHSGQALNDIEKQLIQSSPGRARDLLHNIPRLQAVSEAVYYQDKGFDGSGFPIDNISGKNIPFSARLLKLLKAMMRLSKGQPPTADIFKKLREKAALFDPELLEAAEKCFLSPEKCAKYEWVKFSVSIAQLKAGDYLVEAMLTEDGQLALAANNELTEAMIAKVRQFHQLRFLIEPVHILREVPIEIEKVDEEKRLEPLAI